MTTCQFETTGCAQTSKPAIRSAASRMPSRATTAAAAARTPAASAAAGTRTDRVFVANAPAAASAITTSSAGSA